MKPRSLLRFFKNPLSAIWLVRTRLLPRLAVLLRGLFGRLDRTRPAQDNVVLFHIGRSGSTVLGDLLYQNKRMFWDGEVIRQFICEQENAGAGPDKSLAYICRRIRLATRGRRYGCEIKPFHVQRAGATMDEFVAGLERAGFSHFIVLERRNYLRKVVSSLIAAQTGRWHNSSYEKPERARITIDPDCIQIDHTVTTLLKVLDNYASEFDRLREVLGSRRSLWLTYEDDISSDPVSAYRRVCDFVGLTPASVTTRYARTNPWPLADLIENYSEIDRLLADTPYAWMTERQEPAA